MKDVCVIDYTTDENEKFFIFEAQKLTRSTLHGLSGEEKVKHDHQFKTDLSKDIANKKVNELPQHLNGEKLFQRLLFQQNKKTRQYNPKFIIVNRISNTLNNSEEQKLRAFFNNCNGRLLIKSKGTLGQANIFFRDKNIDVFIQAVKHQISGRTSFVIEEEKMLFSLKTKDDGSHKYDQSLGVYRRDFFLSEKKSDNNPLDIQYFEVCRYFCNMSHTTDSHNSEHTSHEKNYLNGNYQSAKEKLQGKMEKSSEKYTKKEQFFRNIAECIESGLFLVAKGSELSQYFLSEEDMQETNQHIARLLGISEDHAKIIISTIDPIEISNKLLKDYLKGGALGRIVSFHWDRGHTLEVENFLDQHREIKDIEEYRAGLKVLFTKVLDKSDFNMDGSFLRRCRLINKVFERYDNHLEAANDLDSQAQKEPITPLLDSDKARFLPKEERYLHG
ncbi:hypothetical protein L3V79_00870 [Thiotrichales bacterium 19S9-12]|nr:hypothetical protein [Thiotrichales bacterium 19S9-11]MCF6810912.1 hypothetical protein [Thiotrichales bacterium 19S9-12]